MGDYDPNILIKHEKPLEIVDTLNNDNTSSTDSNLFDDSDSFPVLTRKRKLATIQPYSDQETKTNKPLSLPMTTIHDLVLPPKSKKRKSNEASRLYEPIFFLKDLPDRTNERKPKRKCTRKPKKYNQKIKVNSSPDASQESSTDDKAEAEQSSKYRIDFSGEHLPSVFNQAFKIDTDSTISSDNKVKDSDDGKISDDGSVESLEKNHLSSKLEIKDVRSLKRNLNLPSTSREGLMTQRPHIESETIEDDWTDVDDTESQSSSDNDCVEISPIWKTDVSKNTSQTTSQVRKEAKNIRPVLLKNDNTEVKGDKKGFDKNSSKKVHPKEQEPVNEISTSAVQISLVENEVTYTTNQNMDLPKYIKLIVTECLNEIKAFPTFNITQQVIRGPELQSTKNESPNVKCRDIRDFFKPAPKKLISTGKKFEKCLENEPNTDKTPMTSTNNIPKNSEDEKTNLMPTKSAISIDEDIIDLT